MARPKKVKPIPNEIQSEINKIADPTKPTGPEEVATADESVTLETPIPEAPKDDVEVLKAERDAKDRKIDAQNAQMKNLMAENAMMRQKLETAKAGKSTVGTNIEPVVASSQKPPVAKFNNPFVTVEVLIDSFSYGERVYGKGEKLRIPFYKEDGTGRFPTTSLRIVK